MSLGLSAAAAATPYRLTIQLQALIDHSRYAQVVMKVAESISNGARMPTPNYQPRPAGSRRWGKLAPAIMCAKVSPRVCCIIPKHRSSQLTYQSVVASNAQSFSPPTYLDSCSTNNPKMGVGRISTWTRFQLPLATALNESIFEPLQAVKADFDNPAYYGPISESPGEYLLVVDWNTPQAFSTFRNSTYYKQLLVNLRAQSATEPKTQIVDFSNVAFSWRFGSNTDIRTVYFPTSISSQQREAVGKTKGLVLTMTPGLGASGSHQIPYKGVPTIGCVDGRENWGGNDAVVCVWCHYWKDKDAEQQFKKNERRPPRNGEPHRPLAVEAFELDLRNLGAIGWTEHHVDFKQVKLE